MRGCVLVPLCVGSAADDADDGMLTVVVFRLAVCKQLCLVELEVLHQGRVLVDSHNLSTKIHRQQNTDDCQPAPTTSLALGMREMRKCWGVWVTLNMITTYVPY